MDKIRRWSIIHAIALLTCALAVITFRTVFPLSLIGLFSFLWFIIGNSVIVTSFHEKGNHANKITLVRICFSFLIGVSYPVLSDISIAVAAVVIIVLDGVDGYLARRFSAVSKVGACFDMETDAFFVCIMSSLIYLKGLAGPWILVIGYMRYLYEVLLAFLKLSDRKGKPSRFARTIAGILFSTLITPFILNEYLYLPCLTFASLLLIISFSHSFMNIIFMND